MPGTLSLPSPWSGPLQWRCLPFEDLTVTELYAVLRLRSAVFVVEQSCLFQDMDGLDSRSHHLLGQDGRGQLWAYARLLPPGLGFAEASVGRVVTEPAARGHALGHSLMDQACAHVQALWGPRPIRIGAQAHLQRFYGRHGFVPDGPEYLEDGIAHVEMRRPTPLEGERA